MCVKLLKISCFWKDFFQVLVVKLVVTVSKSVQEKKRENRLNKKNYIELVFLNVKMNCLFQFNIGVKHY